MSVSLFLYNDAKITFSCDFSTWGSKAREKRNETFHARKHYIAWQCYNFLLLISGINKWCRNVWIWPSWSSELSSVACFWPWKLVNILSLWCLQIWRCLWIHIKPKLALGFGCLIKTPRNLSGAGSSVRKWGKIPKVSFCNRSISQLPVGCWTVG